MRISSKKVLAFAVSAIMAFSLCPATAMADDTEPISITGGGVISEDGTYQLTTGSTGAITVDAGVTATVVGLGSSEQFQDLSFQCGNEVNLTIKDLQENITSAITSNMVNFKGDGTFNIEGTNIIIADTSAGCGYAIVHIGTGHSLKMGGDGTWYSYLNGMGQACFGAGQNDTDADGNTCAVCGNIDVTSGTWYLKQSKRNTNMGSDDSTTKGGTITFSGGEFYSKGISMAPGIGSTYQGKGSNIVVKKDANVTLYQDYTGLAISGNGSPTLDVQGGSLKLIKSTNAIYGNTVNGSDATCYDISACGATCTKSMMIFDAYKYKDATSIQVKDSSGTEIYNGKLSTSVTNEVKNPGSGTMFEVIGLNWLPNDTSSQLVNPTMGSSNNYPTVDGTILAPDYNLGLWLTKEDTTFTVNGDKYTATYDSDSNSFTYEAEASGPYDWYGDGSATEYTISDATELAGLAAIVNGTAEGITQSDFAGKTVKLDADIDLSSTTDFAGIGTSAASFAGTFDGCEKTVKLAISSTDGYCGLFGKTAATATIKNLTLEGTVTSTSTGDYVGGLVAYNMGKISNINSKVVVTASSAYNVGGICGFNDGGYNAQVGTTATGGLGEVSACITTGNVTGQQKVGGICGENAGTIEGCLAYGTIDGINASSKNGVGGIAGRNGNNNSALEHGVINHCAFFGTVGRSGQKWVGGITGFCAGQYGNTSAKPCEVTNCYMAGTLVAGGGKDNAIVGQPDDSNVVCTNNYSLSTITANTGSSEAEIGIQKTAEQMKSAAFVVALNSTGGNTWCFDSQSINNGYPVLSWQGGTSVKTTAAPVAAEGLVYNGTVQTGVASGVGYTVSDGTATNAGDYTATATLANGYVWSDGTTEAKTYKWSIGKATYDMSGVTFANSEVTYDGEAHSLALSGDVPEGVTVSYLNNGKVDAGTYTVVAAFSGDANNYYVIPDMTATLTINKVAVAKPAAATGLVYSGAEQIGVAAGENYTLEGTVSAIDAGSYTATAKLASSNYVWADNTSDDVTLTWSIDKATYDMSGVKFAASKVTYNGKARSLAISGTLPSGVKVTYVNNGKVKAGAYKVTANFTGDANHYAIASKVATLTIAKAKQSTAKIVTGTKILKGCKKGKLKKKRTFLLVKSGVKGLAKVTWKKLSGNKKITVAKTGKVTVKKGLAKGLYKVKVRMIVNASTNFLGATKTKVIKIRIK